MQIWEVLLTWFVEPHTSHAAILELPVPSGTGALLLLSPCGMCRGFSWELLWECSFEPYPECGTAGLA